MNVNLNGLFQYFKTLWKDHEAAGISFKQFLEGITDPTKDVISEDEHR